MPRAEALNTVFRFPVIHESFSKSLVDISFPSFSF
jgi:hypothetical protein